MITATPNPIACPQVRDNPELVDRDLDCAHYDSCLSEAVRRDWESFSCAECPLRGCAQRGELAVEAFISGGGTNMETLPTKKGIPKKKRGRPIGLQGGLTARILERMRATGGEHTAGALIQHFNATSNRVGSSLTDLINRGMVVRLGRGVYTLTRVGAQKDDAP